MRSGEIPGPGEGSKRKSEGRSFQVKRGDSTANQGGAGEGFTIDPQALTGPIEIGATGTGKSDALRRILEEAATRELPLYFSTHSGVPVIHTREPKLMRIDEANQVFPPDTDVPAVAGELVELISRNRYVGEGPEPWIQRFKEAAGKGAYDESPADVLTNIRAYLERSKPGETGNVENNLDPESPKNTGESK